MTPQIFAYLVMPGLLIAVAIIGYAVIVFTNPRRNPEPQVQNDHHVPSSASAQHV